METRPSTPIPEQQIAEAAQGVLDQVLYDFEVSLGSTPINLEVVEQTRDIVAFLYTEFEWQLHHVTKWLPDSSQPSKGDLREEKRPDQGVCQGAFTVGHRPVPGEATGV